MTRFWWPRLLKCNPMPSKSLQILYSKFQENRMKTVAVTGINIWVSCFTSTSIVLVIMNKTANELFHASICSQSEFLCVISNLNETYEHACITCYIDIAGQPFVIISCRFHTLLRKKQLTSALAFVVRKYHTINVEQYTERII